VTHVHPPAHTPGPSRTAEEIVRIAARLFAESGYDATPVRTIAERAGVTSPTLYYYFGSKEGLARAVLLEPIAAVGRALERLLARPLDPVARLTEAADCYFQFSRENPDRARFVYAVVFGPHDRTLAARIAPAMQQNHDTLRRIVAQLGHEGLVPSNLVDELTLALRGQIVIRTMDFLYRGAALGTGLAARVVERVLHGHLGPGQSPLRRSPRPARRPARPAVQ
jgi:AcrR family transcriptional regulator